MKKTHLKKKSSFDEFAKAIRKQKSFLLTCHVTPEGDAIGSLLAMASLLKKIGKKVTIVCQDEFPPRLACLSSKGWQQTREVDVTKLKFDALLTTDCPTLKRIGNVNELIAEDTVIFNIDHHVSNTDFGDYNLVVSEASASAEVVWDLFKTFNVKPSKEDAKNLYIGIATDTGAFRYSNTTSKSHRIVAELIDFGISVEKINHEIYARYSLEAMELYGRLFSSIKTAANGAIAWTSVKREDIKKSKALDEDAEGFIDFLRYIKGVKIAFFMWELENGKGVRVSFRSIGVYDVNKIALHFHGGGHKKASGCIMRTSLREAEKQIVQRITKELKLS
jgi:phosphoesterase RecJ-like protein